MRHGDVFKMKLYIGLEKSLMKLQKQLINFNTMVIQVSCHKFLMESVKFCNFKRKTNVFPCRKNICLSFVMQV